MDNSTEDDKPNTAVEKFESFLEETAEDGVEYVKPKYVELTLTKERKQELRALNKTLNDYGMSQRDKLFLIYIMSLEFESREAMNAIVDGVSVADEHIPKRALAKPTPSKLITNFS
jgi:hypothetical protein